jgi:hypothetical protein
MALFNHATPLNCVVRASSSYGDVYGPDRIIDGSDFTSWCSNPSDDTSVTEWVQVNFKHSIRVEIVRVIWGESLQVYATFTVCFTFTPSNILTEVNATTLATQEFGTRCSPSLFTINFHELRHGLYTWRRSHSQEAHAACRLERKCYMYPNLHMYGVDGWTATIVNNNKKRGRVVDSVRIQVSRHASFWKSTSICRVEIMSPDSVIKLPVNIPCTSSETAAATLVSIRAIP